MLKFSDGESFDTTGEPKIIRRKDGLYVCGGNTLIPIDSHEEGNKIISEMKSKNKEPKS